MSEPPATTLVWCPKCGRTDQFQRLLLPPHRHYFESRFCEGEPMRMRYEPVRQQPLRGTDATSSDVSSRGQFVCRQDPSAKETQR
jgi:hypothetical protein